MMRRSKGLVEIDPLPDTQDETLTYTCCIESEGQAQRQRKDRPMNPQMQTQAQAERSTSSDITLSETDLLAGWGFSSHEITSLHWFRQWYQNGGGGLPPIVGAPAYLRRVVGGRGKSIVAYLIFGFRAGK